MIKIDIMNENEYTLPFDEKRLSKKIAEKVFEVENISYDFSFTISIVSNKKIKSINNKMRGINKSTDVLSFPNIDLKRPSDIKKYIKIKKKSNADNMELKSRKINSQKVLHNQKKEILIDLSIMDMESKTIFLGDVVISYETMLKQAKDYGHSIKREYSFLLTHSLLHLLGYDHMVKKDENKMFKKQRLVLSSLSINR